MYLYSRQIFLRETDASGNILFTEQLNLALEAFEVFLASKGDDYKFFFKSGEFRMPVVNAQADFFSPIVVGQTIFMELKLLHKGNSSYVIGCDFKNKEKELVGKTSITHVCISLKAKKPIPIPESLAVKLSAL